MGLTQEDLAEKLAAEYKIVIDKRKIVLAEPVKTFGTFTADAKLRNQICQRRNKCCKEQQNAQSG